MSFLLPIITFLLKTFYSNHVIDCHDAFLFQDSLIWKRTGAYDVCSIVQWENSCIVYRIANYLTILFYF